MQETDVLIVGQGLAGSWLSWWLKRAGLGCRVMDNGLPLPASRYAAGLINPVTGRRLVKSWMIDELMPFACKAYEEMGAFLQEELISGTEIVDFFPTVQMLQAFQKRYAEDPTYLRVIEDRANGVAASGEAIPARSDRYKDLFRFDLGWGLIRPCCLVQTEKLLTAWRKQLAEQDSLIEAVFDPGRLSVHPGFVEYEHTRYRYIVYCEGSRAAENRFFSKLPFALNKGEALLVEIKDMPERTVFKKGMSLVPWKEGIFWAGSSYQWTFADELPSADFRKGTEDWLKHFLRVPFKVLDHIAALRPATLERRPFAGFHPAYPQIGLFNGLGTKGCSLAPYFANQLAEKILSGSPIHPLVDINRFERILTKPG